MVIRILQNYYDKFKQIKSTYIIYRAAKSPKFGGRHPIFQHHSHPVLLNSRLLAHLGFSLWLNIRNAEYSIWFIPLFLDGLPTFHKPAPHFVLQRLAALTLSTTCHISALSCEAKLPVSLEKTPSSEPCAPDLHTT